MKAMKYKYISVFALFGVMLGLAACQKNGSTGVLAPSAGQPSYFDQVESMGKPLVRSILVSPADVTSFNVSTPVQQGTAFNTKIQNNLLVLNPAYSTNFLGYNLSGLGTLFSTDVLTVSTAGTATTFYNSTNTFTGRNLTDDVVDIELKMIYGGPAGTSNAGLIKDNVNGNDKSFSSGFPYEAAPW